MAKELFTGTNKYNCDTCVHQIGCGDSWGSECCCEYWYNANSKIQGLAYEKQKYEDKMPLFD